MTGENQHASSGGSPAHHRGSVSKQSAVVRPVDRRKSGDTLIFLNIGGCKYEVWQSTLDQYPDTVLGSKLRDRFYDEKKNEFFFDRDPGLFRYILNFYLTGTLHAPVVEDTSAFDDEIGYFQINPDFYMGLCCYEGYLDRKGFDIKTGRVRNSFDEEEKTPEKKGPLTIRENLWETVENPQSSTQAKIFFYVTGFFIALSVGATIIETVFCQETVNPTFEDELRLARCKVIFTCIETACVVVFTCEYCVRLYASPERLKYAKSFMSVVDVISIFPFYAGLCLPESNQLQGVFDTTRVFRVFRVFKLCRSSPGMILLGKTLKKCASDLSSLVMALSLLILVFTTMLYYMEKNYDGTLFTSIPAGFWFTIVTMTTVGYGDMYPSGFLGKLLTAVWAVSSVIVLALPLTILVDTFTNIRESMMKPTRRRDGEEESNNNNKSPEKTGSSKSRKSIETVETVVEMNVLNKDPTAVVKDLLQVDVTNDKRPPSRTPSVASEEKTEKSEKAEKNSITINVPTAENKPSSEVSEENKKNTCNTSSTKNVSEKDKDNKNAPSNENALSNENEDKNVIDTKNVPNENEKNAKNEIAVTQPTESIKTGGDVNKKSGHNRNKSSRSSNTSKNSGVSTNDYPPSATATLSDQDSTSQHSIDTRV
ncbi:PREDICTED: potassium voltage-gated channel protein Shal-like [Branchiostoma belcheri]|uniref:Potassium voltage-gated channel protein Shal-like n=1 Tax=Branchiostoma belcheri TaxID=7741 RepID=A0A6P4YVU0_BRABE|nr:PREDICTED: potassium voltage-gated channel protein Shal-like [Branchiostoma belcheri]